MPLPLPEYADVLCKALWCFSFPKVTFDFRNSQRTQHENMQGVEKCIGALLSHEDQVDVKDGLSNVLYWGYARQGRRDYKVCTFRCSVQSTDDRRLVGFMEFARSGLDACAAERLLALKRLGLPGFGQMSFATKILMFLDPARYPVLDLKIARATANESYFAALQKLTVSQTSVPITHANADAYARWACWCRSIATQINGIPQSPCGYLRAVDVERAVFQLVDSEEMEKVRTLLVGPLDE